MRRLLLLCLVLWALLGQPGIGHALLLQAGGPWPRKLDGEIAVLMDRQSQLGVAEVAAAPAGRFLPCTASALVRNATYWGRIVLDNPEGALRTVVLSPTSFFRLFSQLTVFKKEPDGSYLLIPAGGLSANFHAFDLGELRSGAAISLPAGRTTLLLAMRAADTWHLATEQAACEWHLEPLEKSNSRKTRESLLEGVILGILLIMALYHLSHYYSTASREYLWLSIWVVGAMFYTTAQSGFLATGLSEAEVSMVMCAAIRKLMSSSSIAILVLSGTRMMAGYAAFSRAAYRRTWRLISALTCVAVPALLLGNVRWPGYLPNLLLNSGANLTLAILLCLGLYLMFGEARQGSRAARMFLLSNSAVFLGALVAVSQSLLIAYGHVTPDSVLLANGIQIGMAVQVALLSIAVALRVREVRRERELSDRILHEVLPPSIAARLKSGETGIAERFDSVTVLFADIAGFTPLSAQLPPETVVQTLNAIFSRFDKVTSRLGLEKIKTIGDCYMVVAGMPVPRADHQSVMAEMALEILNIVRAYAVEANADGTLPLGTKLEIRVGVHSGPVVAGVIGTRRFAYDLWGDTVNTASRMESHGEPGRIHCSPAFYEGLRDTYAFEARGQVAVKGKGLMPTYFLLSPLSRRQRTGSL